MWAAAWRFGRDAMSWSRPANLACGGRTGKRSDGCPQSRPRFATSAGGNTVLATLGVAIMAAGGKIGGGCQLAARMAAEPGGQVGVDGAGDRREASRGNSSGRRGSLRRAPRYHLYALGLNDGSITSRPAAGQLLQGIRSVSRAGSTPSAATHAASYSPCSAVSRTSVTTWAKTDAPEWYSGQSQNAVGGRASWPVVSSRPPCQWLPDLQWNRRPIRLPNALAKREWSR
jgi:hypothetical protein